MSSFADSYIAANAGNLPSEALPALRNRLASLSKDQKAYVLAADLKNPVVALIFSFFLGGFGADRFYIGQVGLGVAKLLLSWVTLGIWPLVDLFLIMGATKQVNLQRLNEVLAIASRVA
ncbi:TM2 domain-containing protein [Streptococcus sp. X16XC17]|uniref:TM2 domain-containing protein n=1 Tax=unclassified Streptococcus TaxID=2608887 RepID=UPI00066FC0F6|nr:MULTISPECIES: TM2 domain-containing protein [unclassified Streptococcus]TCD46694.1 TM2 domain-containing protein [Streptococcus sp. X16XC17]